MRLRRGDKTTANKQNDTKPNQANHTQNKNQNKIKSKPNSIKIEYKKNPTVTFVPS
jgi:hypothetical protein